MTTVERTEEFAEWESKLKGKDLNAAARVAVRIQRLALGNPGDVKPVGEGPPNCGSHTARATGSTTSPTATC